MVDNQPYGKLIAPQDETKYQLNLLPGTHECYLDVIPKDENEEIYKSNVLVCYQIFCFSYFNFFFLNRKLRFKLLVV
jgi:hypothetical protein